MLQIENNRKEKREICFGGICLLHLQDWKVSQTKNQYESDWRHKDCFLLHAGLLLGLLTLKMEAACYSDTSVDFQRTPRSYIPEERTFYLREFSELVNPEGLLVTGTISHEVVPKLNEKPAVKLSVPLRNTSLEQVSCRKLIYTT
jgi:hypothetical protein